MSNLQLTTESKFPVHLLYTERASQWKRCRDILAGSDVVKAMGSTYLPALSGQTTADYNAYKQRALFFGISGRILSTNSGVIVRRSPILDFSTGMARYFEKDNVGILSFQEIFRQTIREMLSVGRVGMYIDVADNLPVPVLIPTENIINWIVGDDGRLVSVLLQMSESEIDNETFKAEYNDCYFRLFLNASGTFSVQKYNSSAQPVDVVQPSIHGRTLKYIPFTCANVFGLNMDPVKSPMLDIVDINISHYQTSADLENGRHFVGLPTPYVTGGSSDVKLRVGESHAWIIPNEKARVGYLEFLGQGLDSLSKALAEKQGQMSQFSAQLMDTSTRGSEAEGTVRLRYSSDSANLSDIALSTESMLRMTYMIMADWLEESKPKIELNKDFISTKMTYQELVALHKARVEGSITQEVFNYNLVKGELKPEDMANPVTEVSDGGADNNKTGNTEVTA